MKHVIKYEVGDIVSSNENNTCAYKVVGVKPDGKVDLVCLASWGEINQKTTDFVYTNRSTKNLYPVKIICQLEKI